MAAELRGLNEQQAAFVHAYVSEPETAGNATKSAIAAGYSEASARTIAQGLLAKAHVKTAIRSALLGRLSGSMTVLAVGVLEELARDTSVAAKVRLDAAKAILDRAGLDARPGADSRNGEASDVAKHSAAEGAAIEASQEIAAILARHSAGRLIPA